MGDEAQTLARGKGIGTKKGYIKRIIIFLFIHGTPGTPARR